MGQASKLSHLSEQKRIDRAFRAIRKTGSITVTGMCCQSCSWAKAAQQGAGSTSTVAIHHEQGMDHAFPTGCRGRMRAPLSIYHQGDSRLICGILLENGLNVKWDGDVTKAIEVRPDKTMPRRVAA